MATRDPALDYSIVPPGVTECPTPGVLDQSAPLCPFARTNGDTTRLPRNLTRSRGQVVSSLSHDARRAADPRAAARPRSLRAQYPEDGRPREGRRQEAPPPRQDAQVPGDRAAR